jgi:hypothetical protein
MKSIIRGSLGAAAFLVALSACDSSEPLRDPAYFEGLGFEKTLEFVRTCAAEKKSLVDKSDAEGLDSFAKSSHGKNCHTGFDYAVKQEAELVSGKAKLFASANSEEEIKQLKKTIYDGTGSRLGDALVIFKDWKTSDLSRAYFFADQAAGSRQTKIMIEKMGNGIKR